MKMLSLTSLALAASVLPAFNAKAAVNAGQRALVVVSELEEGSMRELAPLYSALEAITVTVPKAVLSSRYAQTKILSNQSATLSNLKDTLYKLAATPSIKAIDVIINLHGLDEELFFYNGGWRMSEIQEELLNPDAPYTEATKIAMKRKLRMLYSTACYGASHNNNWNAIGFDVSAGAVGVNANAEFEYGGVIGSWSGAAPFSTGFQLSNTDAALAVSDTPVRIAGELGNNSLRHVNSKKILRGNTALTINSDPQ
jgi:hypothetical protein